MGGCSGGGDGKNRKEMAAFLQRCYILVHEKRLRYKIKPRSNQRLVLRMSICAPVDFSCCERQRGPSSGLNRKKWA